MDFAVPADHKVKIKESEKKNKYLKLTRELKRKQWDMKVTVVSIVFVHLRQSPKDWLCDWMSGK